MAHRRTTLGWLQGLLTVSKEAERTCVSKETGAGTHERGKGGFFKNRGIFCLTK
jgi:hypothetical protein